MGNLERLSRESHRRNKIKIAALQTVQIAGVLALAVAVPNAVQGFQKLGLLPGARQAESMRRSYARLVQRGYLTYNGRLLRLTKKGERELDRLLMEGQQLAPRRWDGKWRVLIFDIPEKQRRTRGHIRSVLQRVGFYRLQDSVWVYPHDCEDMITLLKADLHIGSSMLYMIVDQLEGDERLKEEFGLKK